MAAETSPILFSKQASLPTCLVPETDDSCIEGLTCPVCCEPYSSRDDAKIPRILSSCGHTLCSACINTWSQKHDNMRRVCCPLCCANTSLPHNSTDDLPKNFAILDVMAGAVHARRHSPSASFSGSFNGDSIMEERFCEAGCAEESDVMSPAKVYCFNCSMYMCSKCTDLCHCAESGMESHEIKTVAEIQKHFFQQSPTRDSIFLSIRSHSEGSMLYCKIHKEPLKIFCETDNVTICIYCQLHGKHKGHDCVMIEEMAAIKTEALQGLKEKLKEKQEQCVVGFNLCKRVEEGLHDTEVQLKSELDNHFSVLHAALEARKKELSARITEEIQKKATAIACQASVLADAVGDLKTKIGETESFCQESQFDVFQKSDSMVKTVQDMLSKEYDHDPEVSVGAVLNFDEQSTLIHSIMEYGDVQTTPGRIRDLNVQVRDENKLSLLTWKEPADGGSPDTYTVEYCAGDRQFRPVYSGSDLVCQLHGSLSNQFTHKYRVKAENQAGSGPYSPPLSFKTRDTPFCWDHTRKSSCVTLTNDNLTAAVGDHMSGFVTVGGNKVLSEGQHYWELSLDRFGRQSTFRKVVVGVLTADAMEWERSHAFLSQRCCPLSKQFWAVACGTGKKISSHTPRRGVIYFRGKHFSEHDRVGILLDLKRRTLEFFRNGESLGVAFDDVVGPVIPMVSMRFQKTVTLSFPPTPSPADSYVFL